jgi:predicted GIY-YIG superfamily endonuclease
MADEAAPLGEAAADAELTADDEALARALADAELSAEPRRPWFVYLLLANPGAGSVGPRPRASYIGATVDLAHRLRQHNGAIKGGARATSTRKGADGAPAWRRVLHAEGFPTSTAALQFEWAFKRCSVKFAGQPVVARLRGLLALLRKDRPTKPAAPFASYPGGAVRIVFEDEGAEAAWVSLLADEPPLPAHATWLTALPQPAAPRAGAGHA